MRFSTAIMLMGAGTAAILAAAHGVVALIHWAVNL